VNVSLAELRESMIAWSVAQERLEQEIQR